MDIEAADHTGGISRVVGEEMGDILCRPPLAPADHFFDCGGDSLRAVDLVSRLTSRWRPGEGAAAERLSAILVTAIFDDPSPRHLAAVIEEEINSDG